MCYVKSSELPLPKALCKLIESGFWPADTHQADFQNIKPLVAPDKVRAFADDEEPGIFLYSPPFYTVRHLTEHGEEFWDWPSAAVHEIDPDLTLLIGDFGSGSDAPIALDYRRDRNNPSVIRLQYLPQIDNWSEVRTHWVEIAPSFHEFAKVIVG